MTELLRQAIAQIEKLPPEQQDDLTARFLAELQDDGGVALDDLTFNRVTPVRS